MKINSPQLGELNYRESDVITFEKGLYGFEDSHLFLYVKPDETSLFSYLQNVEDPSLIFIVVDGYEVIPDYKLEVSQKELDEVGIEKADDICSFLIVTIPEQVENISVNLLGPVVINTPTRKAKQMISLDSNHTTQYPLIQQRVEQKVG